MIPKAVIVSVVVMSFLTGGSLVYKGFLHLTIVNSATRHQVNNAALDESLSWNNETITNLILAASAKYLPRNDKELSLFMGLGFGSVLEMEDPIGGRSYRCLGEYFDIWKDQQGVVSRIPLIDSFFEWLDYGDGIDLNRTDSGRKNCKKAIFNKRRYHKFTETDRRQHEVQFGIRDANQTTSALAMTYVFDDWPIEDGTWTFVWGTDKKLYLINKAATGGIMGHSTFFCGRPVLFAGEMGVDINGTLTWVSDRSGHYKPTLRHMRAFVQWLQVEMRVDSLETIEWRRRKDVVLSIDQVMARSGRVGE